jgi:acetyl esterase/lipase
LKHSPNYLKFRRRAACLFLFAIFSCQSKISSENATVDWFADSFITPSLFRNEAGKPKSIPLTLFDSLTTLVNQLKSKSPGDFSAILKDSSGDEYAMGYCAPPNIRTDTTYPLIIYLHGGTGSLLTTKGTKAFDMLRPLADTFALFLASPSANRNVPWWSPTGIARILQTLRFMTLHYPINPDKIFLAGVSDGATGCYAAANLIAPPFAGFFAISGFGGMLPQVGIRLNPENIMQRPIYNVNAGKDRIYDIAQVNGFLDWLLSKGARVTRKEYPDEMHGFDYRAKEFGTIAMYVRTWSRPTMFRGINWTFTPGFPNIVDNLPYYETAASARSAHMSAFWKEDTLEITEEGIAKAIVSFPTIKKPKIFARINGAAPRAFPASRPDAALLFLTMQHDCFPFSGEKTAYQINIH